MEKQYRGMAAFDFDNTLLDHNTWKISDSSLTAIRKLKKNGYLTVLATGRNMHDRYSKLYIPKLKVDVMAHRNGNTIAELLPDGEEKLIMDHRMNRQLLERLITFSEKEHLTIGACVGEEDFFTWPEKIYQHDLGYWGTSSRNFKDVRGLLDKNIAETAYIGDEAGADKLRQAFPELEVLMFSRHDGADVFEKGYTKADALKVIIREFRIPEEETYAFGDSFNDIGMLQAVRHGIAMGNAVEEVRTAVDYVTDPIDQDGIYNALVHFGVITP